MKGVQCYELFGGIALKIHICSLFTHTLSYTIHLLMTYNHRCLFLFLFLYQSYFTLYSHVSDVKVWATANMLKLKDSKTELMPVTSKRTKHLHNLPTLITIGNA